MMKRTSAAAAVVACTAAVLVSQPAVGSTSPALAVGAGAQVPPTPNAVEAQALPVPAGARPPEPTGSDGAGKVRSGQRPPQVQ